MQSPGGGTEQVSARARPLHPARSPGLSIVNEDGSPHVTAVGALWLDGTFWFQTGTILEQPQNCVLCGRQTLLIEPYDGRPCHKSCAEDAIGQRAAMAPGTSQTS
jgi:hypothetical protein